MAELKRLKDENKSLKETCEILADKKVLGGIKKSLKEIELGKSIRLSDLKCTK